MSKPLWIQGFPVVVFASSGGSLNSILCGMIDACAQFIEEGRVQFFTVSMVKSGFVIGKIS